MHAVEPSLNSAQRWDGYRRRSLSYSSASLQTRIAGPSCRRGGAGMAWL